MNRVHLITVPAMTTTTMMTITTTTTTMKQRRKGDASLFACRTCFNFAHSQNMIIFFQSYHHLDC